MSDNEDTIAICLANGATSTQYNTALMQMSIAQGSTLQQVQDQIKEVLAAAGYTGTPQEQWDAWIADTGGSFGPAYDHTFLVKNFFTSFYGFNVGAGHSGNIDPTTFTFESTPYTITALETSNTSTVNITWSVGPPAGTYEVSLGGHSDNPIICTSIGGTSWTVAAGQKAAIYNYLSTLADQTINLFIEKVA